MPCALRCVLLFIFYWYHNHQSCLVSNLGVWSKLQHVYMCILKFFYCPVSKGVSRGASPNVLWIPPVLGEATLAYTSSFPQELLSTTTTHGSLKMLHKWCTFWKISHVGKSNLRQKVRLWHDANAKFTTFMLAIARVGLTNTHWWGEVEVEYLR